MASKSNFLCIANYNYLIVLNENGLVSNSITISSKWGILMSDLKQLYNLYMA